MTTPNPSDGELSGRQWSEGRKEFEKQARAYAAAENYEIASAIADSAPEAIHAAITAELNRRTPPAAGQSGWKLVPVEPDMAMKIAGDNAGFWCADKYRAMLSAAPPPPAAAEGKGEWTDAATNQELQREIGRLQNILVRRVCGDPMGSVSSPPASAGDA